MQSWCRFRSANLWPLMVCSEGECQWMFFSVYLTPSMSTVPGASSYRSYIHQSNSIRTQRNQLDKLAARG
jgi:hypothetical protein